MIHIVQLLCPSRHCIVAAAYDPADAAGTGPLPRPLGGEDLLRAQFDQLVAAKAINPWCGICGSKTLTYEDRATRFETMAEATPAIRASEEAQRQTREFIERSRH
jgi:hypothetical protein